MVASDSPQRWPAGLLDDPRVVHYWDEERAVGKWFASEASRLRRDCGEIAWDAYYLFPKEAKWNGVPAPLTISGCPIVHERDELAAAIDALAKPKAQSSQ